MFLDDSSFPFNSRINASKGTQIIRETFASIGLEMHCGNELNPKSKMEILWIPPPSFYSRAATQSLPPTSASTTTPAAPCLPSPPSTTHPNATNPAMDTTDEHNEPVNQAEECQHLSKARKRPLTFYTMTQKQREELYWNSPNTNRITISDDGSFIDFTAHFKYLGSHISFDLTDDLDIKHRISTANKAMGALRHFWRNPYADLRAKKLIFLAIPANLLLWGCETWALRQTHIDQLNVFWHRAIRNILGIRMSEVIDDHISNETIRKIFHDIPDAGTALTARAMTYLGKTARAPDSHPPKPFITAWIKNPRPKSGVLTTNKKALVRGINTLLPDETLETRTKRNANTGETTTYQIHNPDGKLSNWLPIALDKRLWEWHIHKLCHPNGPIPPRPTPTQNTDDNPPHTEGQTNHDDTRNNNRHRRRRPRDQQRTPGSTPNRNHHSEPHPDPTQNHTRCDYDPTNVGRTRADSLRALGLNDNATDNEIKLQFRRLSLIYHPDKYSDTLGISEDEATAHFQILNNAYSYLRNRS